MIEPLKIAQAKQAILAMNHKVVYCPHCQKLVTQGVVSSPLAKVLLEVLEDYGTKEIRPGISSEPENSDHERSDRGRKGRKPKKA